MNKTTILAIAALLLISIGTATAFAAPLGIKQHMRNSENNTALTDALKSGDYQAYLRALDDIYQKYRAGITEEKFNEIAKLEQERSQNLASLQNTRTKIENALETGDYNAWKEAIGSLTGNPNGIDKITEDNFPKFAEMYKAKKEGNNAEAKRLADELGIKYWPGPVKSHFRGCSGR